MQASVGAAGRRALERGAEGEKQREWVTHENRSVIEECGLRYKDNGHRDWHGALTRNDRMSKRYEYIWGGVQGFALAAPTL